MAKRNKKVQRLSSTSGAGRVQRSMESFKEMKQDIASMSPDTIVHIGERLVMTETHLLEQVQEYTRIAKAVGAETADVYNLTRAMLGLKRVMTAGELLAMLGAVRLA